MKYKSPTTSLSTLRLQYISFQHFKCIFIMKIILYIQVFFLYCNTCLQLHPTLIPFYFRLSLSIIFNGYWTFLCMCPVEDSSSQWDRSQEGSLKTSQRQMNYMSKGQGSHQGNRSREGPKLVVYKLQGRMLERGEFVPGD